MTSLGRQNQEHFWIFVPMSLIAPLCTIYIGTINQQAMNQLQYPFCGLDMKSRKEQLHCITNYSGGPLQKNSGVPFLMNPIVYAHHPLLTSITTRSPNLSDHTSSSDT